MAKPGANGVDVDTRLQQMTRCGVSNDMRADLLIGDGRLFRCRPLAVSPYQIINPGAGKGLIETIEEDPFIRLPIGRYGANGLCSGGPQGTIASLRTFAEDLHNRLFAASR